jgi:cytochrome P450
LAMNGDQHRRNRRIVKEPFGLRAISNYGGMISRLTDELLATWRPGDVRDIAEEMRQYMLRVTSTVLFGMDDPVAACRLGDMIARWVSLNHEVGVGALVPNEGFNNGYEQLLSFADELEAEVMGMIRRRRASSEQGSDVLSILIRSNDEEGGLSDEELVGQAAVLFGAAHMTTAHSLTWTLLLLAQHPSIMRQLWTDLNSSESGVTPQADGSLPKGDDLSLLDRVIKESMRLLPASAYSQRVNSVAVQLGPLELTRGTGIVFTPIITHHLPDLYPQPEKFIPDRWKTLRPSPYAYHPFGAGPRLCIGAPLATAVIRIALQRILTSFRLSAVPGSNVSAHIESTMLFPTHGVPMQIHAPDGQFTSCPIVGNIHDLVDFDELPDFAVRDDAAAIRGDSASIAPRLPR